MGVDPLTGGAGGDGPRLCSVRYRKGTCQGMQNALEVITGVHAGMGQNASGAITRRWSRNTGWTTPTTPS